MAPGVEWWGGVCTSPGAWEECGSRDCLESLFSVVDVAPELATSLNLFLLYSVLHIVSANSKFNIILKYLI